MSNNQKERNDSTDKTIAKIINNQKERNDSTDKNTKDEENLDSNLNKKQAEQYLNMIKDKHNLSIDYFKYTYWII
ncbi:hypothetical protein GQR61_07925, partial [Campylobacter lari]|nr:hypothetical protein [Campylobacter lari]